MWQPQLAAFMYATLTALQRARQFINTSRMSIEARSIGPKYNNKTFVPLKFQSLLRVCLWIGSHSPRQWIRMNWNLSARMRRLASYQILHWIQRFIWYRARLGRFVPVCPFMVGRRAIAFTQWVQFIKGIYICDLISTCSASLAGDSFAETTEMPTRATHMDGQRLFGGG